MSFANLKKNSKASFEKVKAQQLSLKAQPAKTWEDSNEGFWKPKLDKAGLATVKLRFLPVQDETEDNVIKRYKFFFKGPVGPNGQPARWYAENSLRTIDKPDPMAEFNSELWNQGDDAKDKQMNCPFRKRCRAQQSSGRREYISNVLIIDDANEPENNGKVFHWIYTKTVNDLIDKVMFPSEEDIENEDAVPLDPWNMFDGPNFILKVTRKGDYPNYETSKWTKPTAAAPTEAEMEAIYKQTKSVMKYLAPDQFKSYDELKAKVAKVMWLEEGANAATERVAASTPSLSTPQPSKSKARKPAPVVEDDDDEFDVQAILNASRED